MAGCWKPQAEGTAGVRPRAGSSPRRERLLGFGDLDCAEAYEWAVDKGDLHRDVGLDMHLAEEREDLSAGQLFDRLLVCPCVALERLVAGLRRRGGAFVTPLLLVC